MNLFFLMKVFIGGEPEDNSGIQEIVATGHSAGVTLGCLPDGYTSRELTADEDSFLECNVATCYELVEVTSPGVATVVSTTTFYPVSLDA